MTCALHRVTMLPTGRAVRSCMTSTCMSGRAAVCGRSTDHVCAAHCVLQPPCKLPPVKPGCSVKWKDFWNSGCRKSSCKVLGVAQQCCLAAAMSCMHLLGGCKQRRTPAMPATLCPWATCANVSACMHLQVLSFPQGAGTPESLQNVFVFKKATAVCDQVFSNITGDQCQVVASAMCDGCMASNALMACPADCGDCQALSRLCRKGCTSAAACVTLQRDQHRAMPRQGASICRRCNHIMRMVAASCSSGAFTPPPTLCRARHAMRCSLNAENGILVTVLPELIDGAPANETFAKWESQQEARVLWDFFL